MGKFQSGGYLVLVSLLMVVLIGIGALALDLGRMFVVRSEIQNAVDSVALAAAAELDGSDGARARAEDVARGLLSHRSTIAEQTDLLNDIDIAFYSALGEPAGSARVIAADDSEARFARVIIDRTAVDLLFLPVLGIVLDSVNDQAFLSAAATAGSAATPLVCDYAPIVWCPPGDPEFSLEDSSYVGKQIRMPIHGNGGSTPGAGGWGFLEPPSGYGNLEEYLEDPDRGNQCINPASEFETNPGSKPKIGRELNIFFGVDDGSSPVYPRDSNLESGDDYSFGNGQWSGPPLSSFPTRLEWHEDETNSEAGRRSFALPVYGECGDLNGRDNFTLTPSTGGFARFFLTEPVSEKPGGKDKPVLLAEYVGWETGPTGGGSGSVGTAGDVQLYE